MFGMMEQVVKIFLGLSGSFIGASRGCGVIGVALFGYFSGNQDVKKRD